MSKPKKNLAYYLGLDYRTECRPLADDEGGGFLCWIPQFGGAAGVSGTGDTEAEARHHLEEIKALCFGHWLKEGQEIDEPEAASVSGRILLRTSPITHAELIERAAREKISLNMLLNQLVASALAARPARLTDIKRNKAALRTASGKAKTPVARTGKAKRRTRTPNGLSQKHA